MSKVSEECVLGLVTRNPDTETVSVSSSKKLSCSHALSLPPSPSREGRRPTSSLRPTPKAGPLNPSSPAGCGCSSNPLPLSPLLPLCPWQSSGLSDLEKQKHLTSLVTLLPFKFPECRHVVRPAGDPALAVTATVWLPLSHHPCRTEGLILLQEALRASCPVLDIYSPLSTHLPSPVPEEPPPTLDLTTFIPLTVPSQASCFSTCHMISWLGTVFPQPGWSELPGTLERSQNTLSHTWRSIIHIFQRC